MPDRARGKSRTGTSFTIENPLSPLHAELGSDQTDGRRGSGIIAESSAHSSPKKTGSEPGGRARESTGPPRAGPMVLQRALAGSLCELGGTGRRGTGQWGTGQWGTVKRLQQVASPIGCGRLPPLGPLAHITHNSSNTGTLPKANRKTSSTNCL